MDAAAQQPSIKSQAIEVRPQAGPGGKPWPGRPGFRRSAVVCSQGCKAGRGLTLFALMVVTSVDVVGRYFFNSPRPGAVELARLMLATLVFLAFPVVTWRRSTSR